MLTFEEFKQQIRDKLGEPLKFRLNSKDCYAAIVDRGVWYTWGPELGWAKHVGMRAEFGDTLEEVMDIIMEVVE